MKNLKYLPVLLAFMSLTSCAWLFYDQYQVFDDEFKNSRKFIARINLDPQERKTEINSAQAIFERVVSPGQDNVKAYFVISRASGSFRIEEEGFLKAGDQSFEIKITSPVTEHKSKTSTSVETYTKVDSTGTRTGQTTGTDESIWIDDKFVFSLTSEMVAGIKNSDEFIVRFYFGPIPATFRFNGKKLQPVHRMLNEVY